MNVDLLRSLHIDGTKTQLGTTKAVLWEVANPEDFSLLPRFLEKHGEKDLYFLTGVDMNHPTKQRAADKDIVARKFFVADFDVRSEWEKVDPEDETPSNDEICDHWMNGILECLSQHEKLNTWSHVVFTGNGLHVYYVGHAIEGPSDGNLFKTAVTAIFNKINKFSSDVCKVDMACCNPGRIIRIPGSTNNGCKFGQGPIPGKILKSRDTSPSALFEMIPEIFLAEQQRKLETVENRPLRKYNKSSNRTIDAICSIDISDLACRLLGLETDGRRFYEPGNRQKDKGFFRIPGSNLIYNEGSDHLIQTQKSYNTFSFVRDLQRHCFDNKQTFDYFREHYGNHLPKDSDRMPNPAY